MVAAGVYDAALRRALIAYKERGRRDLARPLGDLLAAAVGEIAVSEVVLVPVPSSRRAAAGRGGDHMVRLARCCDLPVVRALRLGHRVLDSAGLDPQQRRSNLAGAFRSVPPQGVRSVVLIDDIVTTGATIDEARHALSAAGWHVIGAATVAATPLKFAR
ncbi:MAG TPA: hypothetical protein VGL26_02665 [Jatrophihabitans sp.]